jgi:hypothetical protein
VKKKIEKYQAIYGKAGSLGLWDTIQGKTEEPKKDEPPTYVFKALREPPPDTSSRFANWWNKYKNTPATPKQEKKDSHAEGAHGKKDDHHPASRDHAPAAHGDDHAKPNDHAKKNAHHPDTSHGDHDHGKKKKSADSHHPPAADAHPPKDEKKKDEKHDPAYPPKDDHAHGKDAADHGKDKKKDDHGTDKAHPEEKDKKPHKDEKEHAKGH